MPLHARTQSLIPWSHPHVVLQTMKDTEQFIKQSEKELNRIAAVKAKVADKLKQLEEIKAKHLTAHQSAAARHRWVKAAHMTQHSKLRATIDMVVQLQSKSSALKEQAELDRDVASTLVQHACDGMGFMPNGTGWAANGDMTGAVGMMGAPGVPQEASSGLWGDHKRRGNQNVVLDLSDADAAGVLPPWYVDGFTGEPQRRGASPQPVP